MLCHEHVFIFGEGGIEKTKRHYEQTKTYMSYQKLAEAEDHQGEQPKA